jgi:hypothetical protein
MLTKQPAESLLIAFPMFFQLFKNFRNLRNQNFYSCVQKNPRLDCILSQMNGVHPHALFL